MTSDHLFIRALTITAVLLGSTATARAGRIDVPADQETIQAALDAASAGDTIRVAPGVYHERLVIPAELAGLRIQGRGRTIIDCHPSRAGVGDGVVIEAPNVHLSNLTVRFASLIGIRCSGSGLRLEDVTVTGCEVFGAYITGPGARLLDCAFRANQVAVELRGANSLMSQCTVEKGSTYGVFVVGADCRVRECQFRTLGGAGVRGMGARLRIDGCTFTAVASAVNVGGADSRVENNRVQSFQDSGISVTSTTGVRVVGNEIRNGTHEFATGIFLANADHLEIRGNRIQDVTGYGIALRIVVDSRVVRNRIRRCGQFGAEFGGILVGTTSDRNSLVGNEVRDCSETGIQVFGHDTLVADNEVRDCERDGVQIAANSNEVIGNRIENNGAEGLENRGQDCRFVDNRLRKNRLDVTNNGSFSEFARNTYSTGGPNTGRQVD